MDILVNIYLLFVITVSICHGSPSDRHDNRKQTSCVKTCRFIEPGMNEGLCSSCKDYCSGRVEYRCQRGKEWDNVKKKCVSGHSPTCIVKEGRTTTTISITTPSSHEELSKEKSSSKEYINKTSSAQNRDHSSDSTGSMNPPNRPNNLPKIPLNKLDHRRPNAHEPTTAKSCSDNPDEFLLKWIPCQYVLLLSGLIGLLPVIICLFLHMCRHKRKIKRKMLKDLSRISVSTQTIDSAIYDNLLPFDANANIYTHLPYIINNPGHYSNISLSDFENDNHSTPCYGSNNAHDYLELLPSYSYLQMQDVETRQEVAQTLAPLIIDLCDKYKKNPKEYKALEAKLGKCLENEYM